ncbi:hypothetical protein TWF481_010554 [Arthrobotrys musiformis]|uniref:Uncharacterized protein n=1 Tax=Arthrobotrys musiformis TaxID=47236 RepID=A0AAV9W275_9PEZI
MSEKLTTWILPMVAGILLGFQIGIIVGCTLWSLRKRSLRIRNELERLNLEVGGNRNLQQPQINVCCCCKNRSITHGSSGPNVSDSGNGGIMGESSQRGFFQRSSSPESHPSRMWERVPQTSSINTTGPTTRDWTTSSESSWGNISTPQNTSPALEPPRPGPNVIESEPTQDLVLAEAVTLGPLDTADGELVGMPTIVRTKPSPADVPSIPPPPPPATSLEWGLPENWLVPGERIQRSNSVIGITDEFGGDNSVFELEALNLSTEHEVNSNSNRPAEYFYFPDPPRGTGIMRQRAPPGSLGRFMMNNPPIFPKRNLSINSRLPSRPRTGVMTNPRVPSSIPKLRTRAAVKSV